MPNYTTNLNLEKPLQSEQYNINVFNANADKIDQFAGQVPARALTADTLTTARKINGVPFKGNTDIVTGAGFYYDAVTYSEGNLAFIYNQDGKLELYKSLSAGNVGHNPLTSTGYWEKQDLGGSGGRGGRNVGEIIQSSLPLTDAGLHLLDGARLSGDGIYGEFVNYIAELYTQNPTANYFTDETTWQQSITDYGVCGKFVYDSTLNTVRLPKVTGIIEGTTDLNALGDLVEAGLPPITHTHTRGSMNISGAVDGFKCVTDMSTRSGGALKFQAVSTTGGVYLSNAGITIGKLTLTASNNWTGSTSNNSSVNSIYGNSLTVQPQTIKCFVYIVIANGIDKTDTELDIDNIVTDLNNKADIDLTNTTDSAKILMSGMGMPSNRYIDLTLGASGSTYTAPANGYYNIARGVNARGQYVDLVNNTTGFFTSMQKETDDGMIRINIPVRKGDVLRISYTAAGGSNDFFRFFYAQGSESEAS